MKSLLLLTAALGWVACHVWDRQYRSAVRRRLHDVEMLGV